MTVAIVNSGFGNFHSIQNMLKKIGVPSLLTSDPKEIEQSTAVILPGVGAYGAGMRTLRRAGLITVLRELPSRGIPLVGICLGMQLLALGSEEADEEGLGLINCRFVKFDRRASPGPIPHMGWNDVTIDSDSSLARSLPDSPRFYFVHSYFASDVPTQNRLMTCKYGVEFTCAVHGKNLMGFQFHPEKSHKFGTALFSALFLKQQVWKDDVA